MIYIPTEFISSSCRWPFFWGLYDVFYYAFNPKGKKVAHYILSQRNSHEEEIRLVNVGIPELLQIYYCQSCIIIMLWMCNNFVSMQWLRHLMNVKGCCMIMKWLGNLRGSYIGNVAFQICHIGLFCGHMKLFNNGSIFWGVRCFKSKVCCDVYKYVARHLQISIKNFYWNYTINI
jgi:hypothetical protein